MDDLLSLLPPEFPLPPDVHAGADDAALDDWWKSCAITGINYLASTGREFSADDLRELGIGDPRHPNHWGSVFRAAQAVGTIRQIGARPSNTGSRRGGLIRVWRSAA
jgi:hypothetical protein